MHATERSTRPDDAPADLAALRRRLYAPDSTAEDVERYRAAVAAVEPTPPSTGTARAPTRSSRALGVVAAAALLLVGAASTGVLVTARHVSAATARTPSPAITVPPTPSDRQEWLTVPASTRAAFVDSLTEARPAGILKYLYDHPERLPGQLRTVTRADSDERWGAGPSTLALMPSELAERDGSATVMVVLDRASRFTWQATRVLATADSMEVSEVLASDSAQAAEGEAATATFTYAGGAPTRLELDVGQNVRWGVVVVFTD